MAYPRDQEQQVEYWLNQISYARDKVKPLFQACDILAKQYFNEPVTTREAAVNAGMEDPIKRTKSGILYGWIDQSLANMIDRAPMFQSFPETREAAKKINPEDPTSLTFARGQSKVVNYRYRETNQLRVDERVALDAFLYPYGVAKLGYTVDYEKRFQEMFQLGASDLELEDPEDENLFLITGAQVMVKEIQDHRFHMESHKEFLRGPNAPQHPEVIQVFQQHIKIHRRMLNRSAPSNKTDVKREAPFASHWFPDMFLTDSLSVDGLPDARWCAFGWELPIDEVLATPEYSNMSGLEPSRMTGAPEKPDGLSHDGFEVIRGWEIWVKNFPVRSGEFRDLLLVVAEDHNKFLRKEEEWPYDRIDDYPAETLVFQPGLRTWFHKPPLLMGGGDTVQALMNETLDSYLSVIRKQKNVWLVDSTVKGITTESVREILEGPDGTVVDVPGLSEIGDKAIMPLPFHQIPPEKGNLISILQQIFDRSVGTPQPISQPDVDTATEASNYERRNTARENRRSGLLSEFQERKARKMWQMDAQFQPEKLFLVDEDAEDFISISAEMALGEYLTTIDITSHATSLSIERRQWMELLNLFAGLTPVLMETTGMPPNLPEIARRLLVKGGFEERLPDIILPMLKNAANGVPQTGEDQQGQLEALLRDPENPAGAAQAAIEDGRTSGRNIGPADPDAFRGESPDEGRTSGAAERMR